MPASVTDDLIETASAVLKNFKTVVDQLTDAAERVSWKYGHDNEGVSSDWGEWKDLRTALGNVSSEMATIPPIGSSKETSHIDHLQDIALFLGIGGYNGATVEQLLERIKNEFLRLSNLACAQLTKSNLHERDTSKPAEAQGLFRKFNVTRTDGSDQSGGRHHGCEYFVLDVDHDQHAKAALQAYAVACARTHPQLSADLIVRYGGQPVNELVDNDHEFWINVCEGLDAAKDKSATHGMTIVQRIAHVGGTVTDTQRVEFGETRVSTREGITPVKPDDCYYAWNYERTVPTW